MSTDLESAIALQRTIIVRAAARFLGSLPAVHLKSLSENNQNCHICTEPFYSTRRFEYAARLP